MKFKVTQKTIIFNSLIWAAIILIGSYLSRGSENWSVMFIFCIGLFTITNTYLSNKMQARQKKCTY